MISSRIPDAFIDTLRHRINIVEIIHQYVPLKETGTNGMGLCPFHKEKTPSFSVSAQKQLYHCFGCGQSGDVFQFLMDHQGLSFVETIEILAQEAGLTIPTERGVQFNTPDFTEYYAVLEQASLLFQKQLKTHPLSKRAVTYFESRGVTGKIAKQFCLGFVPSGWHHAERALGKTKEQRKLLEAVGLLIKNDNGKYYDRFRDRIMFPIRDRRGRVVGFGGRVLDKSEPKYLNSPESVLFKKGCEVYGLYEAKCANRKLTHLIIVEGYMDVIALSQFGIVNAVATLGTAFNEKHFHLLVGQTKTLYFCFDGDRAGRLAAWRALQVCLSFMKGEYNIAFCFLPNGTDPDSFIREKGTKKYREILKTAIPFMDYLLKALSARVNLSQTDGKARLVALSQPFIQQVPENIMRKLLYQRLGEIVGLAPDVLEAQVVSKNSKTQTLPITNRYDGAKKKQFVARLPTSVSLIDKAIAFLIAKPVLVNEVETLSLLEESHSKKVNIFCRLVAKLKNSSTLNLETFSREFSSTECAFLQNRDLQIIAEQVPLGGMTEEFIGILLQLQEDTRGHQIEALLKQAKYGKLSDQQKETLRELIAQKK